MSTLLMNISLLHGQSAMAFSTKGMHVILNLAIKPEGSAAYPEELSQHANNDASLLTLQRPYINFAR